MGWQSVNLQRIRLVAYRLRHIVIQRGTSERLDVFFGEGLHRRQGKTRDYCENIESQ